MKTVAVIGGQSIFDIAIQHCGSVDASYAIAKANGLTLDATLLPGQALLVPEVTDRRVVEELRRRGVSVGSAYSPAQSPEVPVSINYGLLYSWPVIEGDQGDEWWAMQWSVFPSGGVNINFSPNASKPGSLYVDGVEFAYVEVNSPVELSAGQWSWIADEVAGIYVIGLSNEDFSTLPNGYVRIDKALPRSLVSSQMAAIGWEVPEKGDVEELITLWEGEVPAYFNVVYSGYRANDGGFQGAGEILAPVDGNMMSLWTATDFNGEPWMANFEFSSIYGISIILNYTPKDYGGSIRLCRPTTIEEQNLQDGVPCSPYVGTDGKVYRTVKIASKVWTIDNLAETLMADGAVVKMVEGAAIWEFIKIGAACAYGNNYENVPTTALERFDKDFGLLYNRMAAESNDLINDPDELGWRLPQEVYAAFGGVAGGDLYGLTYRQKLLLELRHSGMRGWDFTRQFLDFGCWVNFDAPGSDPWYFNTTISDVMLGAVNYTVPSDGLSVRLVRPATPSEQDLPDGSACAPYLGNDGKVYQTLKIGIRVYLRRNLAETKYNNGTYIQGWSAGGYVPMTNETWQEQPAGALCCWENDETKI